MANRAYLYPSPAPRFERFGDLPERYYDSRHAIAVSWFFLFQASNIVRVDVEDWKELKLAAPKHPVIELFRARRPLLQPYLQGPALADAAATLIDNLTRWPGEFLLMDPLEVVDDDSTEEARFKGIFEILASARPDVAHLDELLLAPYGRRLSADPHTRQMQVLGCTYWDD